MNKKKFLLLASGIVSLTGFIIALFIIWQPLSGSKNSGLSFVVSKIISHRLPNLDDKIRKVFFLPPEEGYNKVYLAINKSIFDKIDKRKDQSDNDTVQSAADIIFPVTDKTASSEPSDDISLPVERNKLIWKFISNQNQVKPADFISQEFASAKNNVLKMTLNPLSYIDYFLHERHTILVVNEHVQQLENKMKKSEVSALITLQPKQQNFDPKIIKLEIDNLNLTPLILDEIDLQTDTSAGVASADLIFGKGGNLTSASEILGAAMTNENSGSLKFSGMNFQISGKDSSVGSTTVLFIVSNQQLGFKSVELGLTNSLTGKQIKNSKYHLINDGAFRNLENISQSPVEFVKQHPQFLLQNHGADKDSIALLPPGKYFFSETVVVPETFTEVRLLPGTTIRFGPGASLVSYSPVIAEGTAHSPITFTAASLAPWGTLAVVNTKDKKSFIRHVLVEEAGPTVVNGIIFSGGLAAHYASIEIYDSMFTRNHGDDGVNIKYSAVTIDRNRFIDNDSDGLDLDAVSGTIKNNVFTDNGGDGLDISWNTADISDNFISNNKDKCLSIGEKSSGIIAGNTIENCDIGVAVKDLSDILLVRNTVARNRQGLAVYQKKPIFGGGAAKLENNIFLDNQTNIWTDEFSTANEQNT